MDSITHIVVGAAVGQLMAGKKYGKRPMIWGAIGGSLPDIDMFANLWLPQIDTYLSHRGITHSILFMLLVSPLLAFLAQKFYEKELHQHKGFRLFLSSFMLIVGLGTGFIINLIAYSFSTWLLVLTLPFTIWGSFKILRIFRDYVVEEHPPIRINYKEVWFIFFVTLFTHLFLDTCTTWGTGLMEPFLNARYAINNISVADIFFTIPAAILLIIGIIKYEKLTFIRLSLSWCSVYLVLTFVNAFHMNKVFSSSLSRDNIEVNRKMFSPSILNNFLWYTVAEDDTAFYFGQHSLFDKQAQVPYFITLPKRSELIPEREFSSDLKKLKKFSLGYYNLCTYNKDSIQLNDLRFGFMGQKEFTPEDYVFRFAINKENGVWKAQEKRDMNKTIGEIWPVYWNRVWGKTN